MTELKPNDFRYVLVTTMKDEAPYILDWIAYHAAIGFTHFVILTNDCSDGTEKICRNLAKLGFVTHINNTPPYPRGIQKTGWKRAERWMPVQEAEWLMCLDVDEYLRLNIGQGTIDEMLRQLDGRAVAISFPWQVFGNDGVKHIEDKPVIEQFTRAAHPLQAKPYQIRGLKTLYQKRFFDSIGTHVPSDPKMAPIAGRHWVTADAQPIDSMFERPVWCVWDNGYGFGGAMGRVNHYALRSKDAFFVKYARGFVNRTSKGVRSEDSPIGYWNMFDWNIVEDRDILERQFVVNKIKEELISDPKILRLHINGLEWHLERVRELLDTDSGAVSEFNQIYDIPAKVSLDRRDPVLTEGNEIGILFDSKRLHDWARKAIIKPIFIDTYYQRFMSDEQTH